MEETNVPARVQIGPQPTGSMTGMLDWRRVKGAICEEAARLCAEPYTGQVDSLVLTGSLARDEATGIEEAGAWNLLSDAEFLLVLADRAPLLSAREEKLLSQHIEDNLAARKIHCKISLSSCHADYLRGMRPHIFAYELKTCGQVVSGNSGVLRFVPNFSPAQIAQEDAWRLLCNRMVEHLGVASALTEQPAALPRSLHYHTVKLYLDMATSILLFIGSYEPTYRQRAARLQALTGNDATTESWPFPMRPFAERVGRCTQAKLSWLTLGSESQREAEQERDWALWTEAIDYLHLLWRWELVHLSRARTEASDHELMKAWMQRQSACSRFRGWAYVLRRQGWLRSWTEWPRWGWRATHASPRYWVYLTASDLFFRLPSLLGLGSTKPEVQTDYQEMLTRLPMISQPLERTKCPSWQRVAADISWNYSEFVIDTRS